MRKCFERIDGAVNIEPETDRKVSELADEVANRLLADNPDVDVWDLDTLFEGKFGHYYALAWARERTKSQNITNTEIQRLERCKKCSNSTEDDNFQGGIELYCSQYGRPCNMIKQCEYDD